MGKASRDKGARREREFVQMCIQHGLHAQRVPNSGSSGGIFGGDVRLWLPKREEPAVIEVKGRKTLPKSVCDWLDHEAPDMVAIKADHKPWIVVMYADKLYELMQQ